MNRFRILVVSLVFLLPFRVAQASEKASAPPSVPATAEQPAGEGTPLGIDKALIETIENYRCTGDLDAIMKFRFLRLLVVYSKTFYFLDGTEQRGAIYEYAKQFESFLNSKLKTGRLPVHVAFIPVRSDELLPFLVEGQGDIAASDLTITPERQRIADFSVPINAGEGFSEVVVTGPAAPPISTVEDLAGKEVYVRTSSSYYATLCQWNEKFRKDGKREIVIKAADENLEDEDILELVDAGVVEMTVVDNYLAEFWKGIHDRIHVREDLALKAGEHIGWAVRKGNPKLAGLLNEFIRGHRVTSVKTSPILRRYLADNRWVKNPATDEERRKFHDIVDVFRKYGAQYNLDYLLIAAQAYQESGLNQDAKSPRGAVGIMQIKPETAAAHPIYIQNVEVLDNNVHAGVKYLRFFVDTYYSNKDITPINKALFALASYNAGPARISSLRRRAAAERLDPNKWFDNVERVVARDVGQETVRYVRNIFKYFVAYDLLQEQEMNRKDAMSRERSGDTKPRREPTVPP